jgi:carboxypeptidase PM20D1
MPAGCLHLLLMRLGASSAVCHIYLQDWQHPPFSGTIAGGYVWGRGAMDIKGAAIALLEAATALLKGGFQPRRTLLIALGHDEEVGGRKGAGEIAALLAARGVKLAMVWDEGR